LATGKARGWGVGSSPAEKSPGIGSASAGRRLSFEYAGGTTSLWGASRDRFANWGGWARTMREVGRRLWVENNGEAVVREDLVR
jgi:hypothetical protein